MVSGSASEGLRGRTSEECSEAATAPGRGRGLAVAADRHISFAARRHHDATLAAATTLADLRAGDTVEVHVDAAMRGLGTGACGPDTLPPYRVGAGTYRWDWTLSAVD